MTARELLDLDISLILLRHGKRSVLQAMARRMQLSDEELRLELAQLLTASHISSIKKKGPPKPFDIASVLTGSEERNVVLRQLHARFENRTFLPELKDVKRFFDRHGHPPPIGKSRTLAQASLFRLLAELDAASLDRLVAESPASRDTSSLGLISDEILRRNKQDEK